MMPATAAVPLITPSRSRKRAYTALELLTLNASFLPQKKPRIQEIEDGTGSSGFPSIAGTPNAASGIGLPSTPEAEVADSHTSSDSTDSSDEDSESGSSSGASSGRSAQQIAANGTEEVDSEESSTSSSSTSSSSSDGESSEAEPNSPTRGGHMASAGVSLTANGGNASELQDRLKRFLPALEVANAQLEAARANGTLADRNMENVEDPDEEGAGQYIEMDLGLGVLEEKRNSNDGSSSSSSGSESESESGYAGESDTADEGRTVGTATAGDAVHARQTTASRTALFSSASSASSDAEEPQASRTRVKSRARRKDASTQPTAGGSTERNVLGKLMGNRRPRRTKPQIEVLDESG